MGLPYDCRFLAHKCNWKWPALVSIHQNCMMAHLAEHSGSLCTDPFALPAIRSRSRRMHTRPAKYHRSYQLQRKWLHYRLLRRTEATAVRPCIF